MKSLTAKQQAREKVKIFKLLRQIGFIAEFDYYFLKINSDTRLCIGFNIPDQCLGGLTGWVWQLATLTEKPLFGYSGSTHVGAAYGYTDKIISITLNKIYDTGFWAGADFKDKELRNQRNRVLAALG